MPTMILSQTLRPRAWYALVLLTLLTSCGRKSSDDGKPTQAGSNSLPQSQTVANQLPPGTGGRVPATSPATNPPTGTRQAIRFAGVQGDQVPGYMWLPSTAGEQKVPAVLVMYGLGGSKEDGTIAMVAQRLNQMGMAAITIDWIGTGERGKIPNAQRILGTGFAQTVGDYHKAMDFLTAQPQIDANRLGYAGASWGADTGLAFVAQDPRVKAMVAIVPVPDPLLGADAPNARIRQVSNRPLLCLFVEGGVDMSDSVCADAQGPQVQRYGFKGADHELTNVRGEVAERATTFLGQALK